MPPIPRTIRVRVGAALATIAVAAGATAVITITGDDGPRLAYLKAPVAGSTVVGKVAVVAKCRASGACSVLQFQIDGAPIGEDTTAPYTVQWDSRSVADGTHKLSAVAVHANGRTEEDTLPVEVTVANVTAVVPADLFVSPTGSNSNGCTRVAPCLSFNRAYQLASGGDVIDVAAGTHPYQEIMYDATKSATPVVFRGAGIGVTKLGVQSHLREDFRAIRFATQTIPVDDASAFVVPSSCADLSPTCIRFGQVAFACEGKTTAGPDTLDSCVTTDSHCADGVSCRFYGPNGKVVTPLGAEAIQGGLRCRGCQNVTVQDMTALVVVADNSNADGTISTGSPAYPDNFELERVKLTTIWIRGAAVAVRDSDIGDISVSMPGVQCGANVGQPQGELDIYDSDIHNITAEKANLGPGYGGNHVGGVKWDGCNDSEILRNRWWHNSIYNILMKDTLDGGSCDRHDITLANNWFGAIYDQGTGLPGGAGDGNGFYPLSGCTWNNIHWTNNTSLSVIAFSSAGSYTNSSFKGNIVPSVDICEAGINFDYTISQAGTCGTNAQTGITPASLLVNGTAQPPDMHLHAGATPALAQMTSGFAADDIDGDLRSNPADIGADQVR